MFYRIHRRFTTWLALLALVMSALAPTVSLAVVMSSDRGEWLEVCTTTGVMWVKSDPTPADDGNLPMSAHEQGCDMCTHMVNWAPSEPAGLSTRQPARASVLSPAHPTSVHPAALWAPAQSRAPPLLA